jgi:hypothetical protein
LTIVPVELPETAHIGDGATASFLIGFELPSTADLRVDVSRVTLDFEDGYSVVGSSVVFAAPPAEDAPIWFRRASPIRQAKEFPTQPTMKPLAVEEALNERARVDQELGAQMTRALAVPVGEAGMTLLSAAEREGYAPMFADGGMGRFDTPQVVMATNALGQMAPLPIVQLLTEIGIGIIDDGPWGQDEDVIDDGGWG